MVYNIRGGATDFEYLPLRGLSVTVKNERTGEEASVTAGAKGAYTIDLDDLAKYPTGKQFGDEVTVRATHRSVTRSWKRRVDGVELVQDLHYTHGTYRGALDKAKLLPVEVFTGLTGTSVTFRDAHTRNVLGVTKNGTLLTETTDWSFTKPATLTLVVALVGADVLEVERSVYRSVAQAKESVVNDGDALIRNAMARYYASPLPDRVPELQHLSEVLAASRLRHLLFSAAERIDSEAENLWKSAQSMLGELRKGERSLTDADGSFVTPSAKAATTPQSSASPVRRFKRFVDDEPLVDL